MTNDVTEEMRQTLLNITSRLLPGQSGIDVRFARCDIERIEELCRRAAEPSENPAIVEQQLAEDELLFGNSFYRIVDGKKVRIPPQELYIGLPKNR